MVAEFYDHELYDDFETDLILAHLAFLGQILFTTGSQNDVYRFRKRSDAEFHWSIMETTEKKKKSFLVS
jgi:hypothetical protein